MMPNSSVSFSGWYCDTRSSTMHMHHSLKSFRRFSRWWISAFVFGRSPVISFSASSALVTTSASVSSTRFCSAVTRLLSRMRSFSMWYTFSTPMMALRRTYALWSTRPRSRQGMTYSTTVFRRSEHSERRAIPRTVGFSSRQSFSKVLMARMARSWFCLA